MTNKLQESLVSHMRLIWALKPYHLSEMYKNIYTQSTGHVCKSEHFNRYTFYNAIYIYISLYPISIQNNSLSLSEESVLCHFLHISTVQIYEGVFSI